MGDASKPRHDSGVHPSAWQQQYLDRYYAHKSGFVNGTTEFHELCRCFIRPGSRILEIGAGPSNVTTEYLARLGEVHGVDVDPAVLGNQFLRDAHVIAEDSYPYEPSSFDVCVSNYVVEHVANPLAHLKEIRRVLRPNGVYVFRSPNLFHYVALASRVTPHFFHRLVANWLRDLPEDAHDPYPTRYRMNTRSRIRKLSQLTDLTTEYISMVEKEPRYGMSSRFLFISFMLYERFVNLSTLFSALRANIFCVLRKPG